MKFQQLERLFRLPEMKKVPNNCYLSAYGVFNRKGKLLLIGSNRLWQLTRAGYILLWQTFCIGKRELLMEIWAWCGWMRLLSLHTFMLFNTSFQSYLYLFLCIFVTAVTCSRTYELSPTVLHLSCFVWLWAIRVPKFYLLN